MKRSFWGFVAVVWMAMAVVGFSQDAASGKATIKLVSGEVMRGEAGGVRDGSLSLVTDYGAIRIPLDKISPESKAKLGISSAAVSSEAMAARVRELESLVERLREENAALRQAAAARPAAAPAPVRSSAGFSSGDSSGGGEAAVGEYRMSSTGKRHNSRCRYYSSKGRACGPGDGVACKICGG